MREPILIDLHRIWDRAEQITEPKQINFRAHPNVELRIAVIETVLTTGGSRHPQTCCFCDGYLDAQVGYFILGYSLWGHGGHASAYACLDQDACELRAAVKDAP